MLDGFDSNAVPAQHITKSFKEVKGKSPSLDKFALKIDPKDSFMMVLSYSLFSK
jgi:hypothetical protein